MEDAKELPLKRVELSLSKFNEVAIPHHLDLLRQHKINILKYSEAGDYARVRGEQAAAGRAAARLRDLLADLAALRERVREADRPRFDALTQRSRDHTLRAIVDYLESSPVAICRRRVSDAQAAASTDSVGLLPLDTQLQLQVDDRELELASREAALRGWTALQAELRALHAAWQTVQAAALAQRAHQQHVQESVETAAENVGAGRTALRAAERISVSALGAGGAVAGALVGGPLGALVGAKAGAAALLVGSALGYLAGRALGAARGGQLDKRGD